MQVVIKFFIHNFFLFISFIEIRIHPFFLEHFQYPFQDFFIFISFVQFQLFVSEIRNKFSRRFFFSLSIFTTRNRRNIIKLFIKLNVKLKGSHFTFKKLLFLCYCSAPWSVFCFTAIWNVLKICLRKHLSEKTFLLLGLIWIFLICFLG